MQLLCHLGRQKRRFAGVAFLLALWLMGWATVWAAAPAPAGTTLQDKLLAEVAQWVQQTQQLTPDQFGFVPIDARVQVQSCDRALAMDLPFASRETVRVRCLGNPNWQMYVRLALKPGNAGAALPSASAPAASSPVANASASANANANVNPTMRKVVVAKQLLRAGTVLSAGMLQETEMPAAGLDPQVVGAAKDLENGEMVREIPAGMPLRSHDVRRAVLVKQGQAVVLTIGQSSGFAITARVEALQDGRMGEQIRLKNPDSGRLLSGVVTGPNAARGL